MPSMRLSNAGDASVANVGCQAPTKAIATRIETFHLFMSAPYRWRRPWLTPGNEELENTSLHGRPRQIASQYRNSAALRLVPIVARAHWLSCMDPRWK